MITIIAAILGAVFRRWFGGGFISAPRWARVVAGVVLGGVGAYVSTLDPLWAICGALAGFIWVPGHGSYMDMGTSEEPDDEFLRGFLSWLRLDEGELRDFIGMILIYSVFTIPIGIAGAFLVSPMTLIFATAGFWVGFTYWAAWRVHKWLRIFPFQPTVVGEYASGAIIYGLLCVT